MRTLRFRDFKYLAEDHPAIDETRSTPTSRASNCPSLPNTGPILKPEVHISETPLSVLGWALYIMPLKCLHIFCNIMTS